MALIVLTKCDWSTLDAKYFCQYDNCMAKKITGKMGRPPKPQDEKRDVMFQIRMTVGERALLDAAAGDGASTWAREVLLDAARKKKKNALK
jgi:hypothetical protein